MRFHQNSLQKLYAVYEQYACARGLLFLWIPVMLAGGIGCYFSLTFEPPAALPLFSMLILVALCVFFWPERLRSAPVHTGVIALILLMTFTAGFTIAQLRTHLVRSPMLYDDTGPVDISGDVKAVETLEKSGHIRLLLENLDIEDFKAAQIPRYVRINVRGFDADKTPVDPGDRVTLLAGLNAPSPPVSPHGFDFQRYAYFKQIGGFGFSYSQPEVIRAAEKTAGRQHIRIALERFKHTIYQRIQERIGAENASVIAALMIGERKGIPEAVLDDIRDVGLAHLLSISGLHVGLIAGTLFFFVRLFLCAVPHVALRWPVKKIATLVAFMGAAAYVCLVGFHIPAVRALLMTAIVLAAILLDRQAITVRLVALAALTILLLWPESLLSASFQLSFAAVTTLIVFYTVMKPVIGRLYRHAGTPRKIALYFLGVVLTTIVASLATTPFSWFHFQQLPLLGLVSNVVVVPLVSLVVMPLILLAYLVMPLGLDVYIYSALAPFVTFIIDFSKDLAAIPYASLKPGALSFFALIMFVLSFLSCVLLRGHIRVICCVTLLILGCIFYQEKQPDIFVSSGGDLIAFNQKQDHALFLSTKMKDRFSADNWRRFLGYRDEDVYKMTDRDISHTPFLCDEFACRAVVGQSVHISMPVHDSVLSQECQWADILVTPLYIGDQMPCPARTVDKRATYYEGAHVVFLPSSKKKALQRDVVQKKTRIISVKDTRGKRPWTISNRR